MSGKIHVFSQTGVENSALREQIFSGFGLYTVRGSRKNQLFSRCCLVHLNKST